MKANKLAAFIVTTYIGFISMAHASTPQPEFSREQEARIGEIAADYLVSHPEILVTVSHKLQEQQEARKQKMFALSVMGVSLDIENYCTLRLFFNLCDFGWPQPTKLTGGRYPVAFPDIITSQIDVLPA